MTAQEYITQAISTSYLNRGDVLAVDSTEMLSTLTRHFQKYYADAATQESSVFAQIVAVPVLTAPRRWVLPGDIDVLHHLEQNGQPVTVVPYEDRTEAEPSESCVYRLGYVLYPVGNATDPTQNALTALYTPVPAAFTALGQSAPASWPTQFDGMVVDHLALWLASKDGRQDDVDRLTANMAGGNGSPGWTELYATWLGRASINVTRRFASPRPVPSPSTVAAGVRKN